MNLTDTSIANLRIPDAQTVIERLDPVAGRPDRYMIKIQRTGHIAVACTEDGPALFQSEDHARRAIDEVQA
jgi:hypothetical protein